MHLFVLLYERDRLVINNGVHYGFGMQEFTVDENVRKSYDTQSTKLVSSHAHQFLDSLPVSEFAVSINFLLSFVFEELYLLAAFIYCEEFLDIGGPA